MSERLSPLTPVPAAISSASSTSSSGTGSCCDLNLFGPSGISMPKPKRRERRLKIASKRGKFQASSTCSSSESFISSAIFIHLRRALPGLLLGFGQRGGFGGQMALSVLFDETGEVAESEQ